MQVKRNTEARSSNHCCSRKGISIIYSECVFVGLGTQHAMRMRHVVIRGLLSSTILFTSSQQRRDLKKNAIENAMIVLCVSAFFFSETFLILRRTKLDMIAMSSCTIPVILA